ncbi:MAG: AIR synthase-related protein [Oscillospiraceae bacterium]|nr:AIR synthase-related protein [Oscillospiraceae bacterium]
MDAYTSRGVSATKDEVHSAIEKHDKGLYPGAFCKIVEDFMGDEKYCSIMHTDDAGTKSIMAYILYKELNDPSVFAGIAVDSVVMNLDDMICVGAADRFIFSNTIGRNAHRIGGDAIAAIINGYSDFCNKMREYGVYITMCGGETSDTGDIVSTIFIDSTFYSRLKRENVIDCDNIKPGDVIVGLASFGKAVYETEYNSGIGSNGLTAARHIVLSNIYKSKYPETFSSTIQSEYIYSGKHKIDDNLTGTDLTVGKALLSPTRTYAPIIKETLQINNTNIHGIVHCTGGGQRKCKNFGKNLHYIKDNLFDAPPIFKLIRESGLISEKEMYQVFNMGHRMEIFCDGKTAEIIIAISKKYTVDAKIIGRVEKSSDGSNKVTVIDRGQTYEF